MSSIENQMNGLLETSPTEERVNTSPTEEGELYDIGFGEGPPRVFKPSPEPPKKISPPIAGETRGEHQQRMEEDYSRDQDAEIEAARKQWEQGYWGGARSGAKKLEEQIDPTPLLQSATAAVTDIVIPNKQLRDKIQKLLISPEAEKAASEFFDVRKKVEDANYLAKPITLGIARGLEVVPILAQAINKYVAGTLDMAIRGVGTGQWDVPYTDTYFAKGVVADLAATAEKFVKKLEKDYGLSQFDATQRTMMFLFEFGTPVSGGIYPAYKYYNMLKATDSMKNSVKRLQIAPDPWLNKIGFKLPNAIQRIRKEVANNPNLTTTVERDIEIARRTEQLAEKFINRIPDNHFLVLPESGQVLYGARLTPKVRAAQETARKLKTFTSVASASVAAGAWHNYYRDSDLKDLAYVVALPAFFATPSAITKTLSIIADPVQIAATRRSAIPIAAGTGVAAYHGLGEEEDWQKGAGYGALTAAGFFAPRLLRMKMPGVEGGARFDISIPSMIWMGAVLSDKLKGGVLTDSQAFLERLDAVTNYRVPLIKAFTVSAKKTEIGGPSDLDLAKMTKGELKAYRAMAEALQKDLPDEVLNSMQALFRYVKDINSELSKIGADEHLGDFMIALEDVQRSVILSSQAGIIANTLKNTDIRKNLFSMLKPSNQVTSMLDLFRTGQTQSKEQFKRTMESLEKLTGGRSDVAAIFQKFSEDSKRMLDEMDGKLDDVNLDLNTWAGRTERAIPKELLLQVDTALQESLFKGLIRPRQGDLSGYDFTEWGGALQNDLLKVFNDRIQIIDDNFESATEAANKSGPIDTDDFFKTLHGIRTDENAIVDVFPALKNRNKVSIWTRTNEPATGQLVIDTLFTVGRYNYLETVKADEVLEIAGSVVKELRLASPEVNKDALGLLNKHYLDELGNQKRFMYTETGGKFDLSGTIANAEKHAADMGLDRTEYLRKILSNLHGGPDQAVNEILIESLPTKMSIHDMHRLRSSISKWSYQNKNNPAGVKGQDIVKAIDEAFEPYKDQDLYTRYEIARDQHSKRLESWRESTTGGRIYKALVRGYKVDQIGPDEELLANLLTTKDTKRTKELFEEMFSEMEKADGTIETFAAIRKSMEKNLDITLGVILSKNNGKLIAGTREQNLDHLSGLREQGLISQEAFDAGKKIITTTDEAMRGLDDSPDIVQNTKAIIRILFNAKKEAIQDSALKEVVKSKSIDDLFEYLVPQRVDGAAVADTTALSEARAGSPFRVLGKARDESPVEIDAESYKFFEPISGSTRLSRIDAVIKDVLDIDDFDQFMDYVKNYDLHRGSQIGRYVDERIKRLDDLEKMLISQAIRKSTDMFGTHKNVVEAAGEQQKKGWRDKVGDVTKGFFSLSTDINLVTYGELLEDMAPTLKRIQELKGESDKTVCFVSKTGESKIN